MRHPRTVAALAATLLMLTACGGSGSETTEPTTTTTGSTTTAAVEPTTTVESTTTTSESTTASTAATSTAAEPVLVAVWPAADVVFATPEEAAADFVASALRVPPSLGDYMAGDGRSGEIEVLLFVEGDPGPQVARSLLAVRQLGPSDGWFVLAAMNEFASITEPEAMSEVAAGPLTVTGVGRGFEGLVVVEAFVAGDAELLDQAITQGGSFETPEPFSVTLDLSAAEPGSVVVLLVRGGVGLETDPGEFGAIPVVIAE